MNYDLIEKLIRLANNNPNENEANLAARKVCKFLADHSFHNDPPHGSQQKDWARNEPFNPFAGFDFESIFRDLNVRYPFTQEQRQGSWADEKKKPKWPGDAPFKVPSEQAKEERLLKCRTCKNTKLTKFVGLAELYECNTCQWTTYEAKSKSKT